MNHIRSCLAEVRSAISAAARASGRPPEDIRLIAVSKTHPIPALEAAIAAGQLVFGESTAQEAAAKIAHLRGRGVEWHFIGHLQSNKAKFLPGNFSWLHSLDNVKLAQRLSRLAQEQNVVVNTLIEVNVSADPNKHGIAVEELHPLLDTLQAQMLPGIALRGLTTIGPHPAPDTDIRRVYARLRDLRDECRQTFALPNFTELSMGMSGDYRLAVQEGATMVRVGTAIFGERDYGVR